MYYKQEYYTQSAKRWEKLEQEQARRKSSMTESEKQKADKAMKKELAHLKKRIQEREKHTKRIINHKKMMTFLRLIKKADWCNLRRAAATGAFASGHSAEHNGHPY